jgi:hypothetical protein
MRWIWFAVLAACAPAATVPCQDRLAPGELVITEVFARYKGTGGDRGRQWFEIYNATDRDLELAGLELAAGSGKHRIAQLAVGPHTYTTLGDNAPGELPAYLDYGYGDDLGTLADVGSGMLALRCEATDIATLAYGDAKPGHSRELSSAEPPSADVAADPASWCDASTTFEPGNFGTPRVANDCVPIGMCHDGDRVRPIVTPRAGELAITEVMPSPTKVADASGEWFEVVARADVDLNGVALDRVRDTRGPEVITSQACLHLVAGQHVVFARSADAGANGGLPPVTATFGFALVAGTASAPGDVRVVAGEVEIDAVTWTGAKDGAARALDPGGATWCDATAPYGLGDLGTPGEPNSQCP